MKYIYLSIIIILSASCTKEQFYEMGEPITHEDKSTWEYFGTSSYNWDSTKLVIERAGLQHIFTGEDKFYRKVTFLGLTNHSIRQFMLKAPLKNGQDQNGNWGFQPARDPFLTVDDIPLEMCIDIIKEHTTRDVFMMEDLTEMNFVFVDKIPMVEGGKEITMLSGRKLKVGYIQEHMEGREDMGPKRMVVVNDANGSINRVSIASSDIAVKNGAVHSLPYGYDVNTLNRNAIEEWIITDTDE